MGKASNRKKSLRASGLKQHSRKGQQLLPPLLASNLPLKPVDYVADILPELIWIGSAGVQLGWDEFFFNTSAVLNKIGEVLGEPGPTGLVSSFGQIEESKRSRVVEALKGLPQSAACFPESLMHALGTYPTCPMAWLIDVNRPDHIDPVIGLGYLKGVVRSIWASRGLYATRCRMVPIAQLIKADKLKFSTGVPTVDLLSKYPTGLSEGEQRLVESFTRATFLSLIAAWPLPHDWPPQFWRANWKLSVCEPITLGGDAIEERDARSIIEAISNVDSCLSGVLKELFNESELDLYGPVRDEVVFGILSRIARLFRLFTLSPANWNIDAIRLCLRSVADANITLAWLHKRNDDKLFRRFQEYGQGRSKLLKLHVQALVEEKGREDLADLLEGLEEQINSEVMEEFMPIDLAASFSGISARHMAEEAGLRDLYNFVYSPASGHLHGDWTSLTTFDLVRCGNPLHRFHHIPNFAAQGILDPRGVTVILGLFIDTIEIASSIYARPGVLDRARQCEAEFYRLVGGPPSRPEI